MTNLNIETAKFYDHAINCRDMGSTVAKARRDAIESGDDYTVIGCWNAGTPFFWNGSYSHALNLAKDILFNGGSVKMTDRKNQEINIETARY